VSHGAGGEVKRFLSVSCDLVNRRLNTPMNAKNSEFLTLNLLLRLE
jgi:hypothetical protein